MRSISFVPGRAGALCLAAALAVVALVLIAVLPVKTGLDGARADSVSEALPKKAGAGLEILKPPPLDPRRAIGLVAPAGAVDFKKVAQAERNLKRLGYRVKRIVRDRGRHGYLASPDETRAAEINTAFADPDVGMILCIRGGYGSPRILDRVDFAAARRNPKIFVGFSDVTALLIALRQKSGLVTFHGPMAQGDFSGKYGLSPFATRYFWNLLEPEFDNAFPERNADWGRTSSRKLGTRRTLAPGTAEGRLIGGNLTSICALMGTPYEIETEDSILFLEEVNEEPYRIDRMLRQLDLAGKLSKLKGVLLGAFTRCVAKDAKKSFTTDSILKQYLGRLGVPVLAGFPAGHLPEQATLPLGSLVRLDATRKTLTILESPVDASLPGRPRE